MTKIILFTLLLISSLLGCSTNLPQTGSSKEYEYLAPYLKKDVRWGHNEWHTFITHLSDKHLTELLLEWSILQESSPGINIIWSNTKQKLVSVGNSEVALNSLGGRKKAVDLLQKQINDVAYTFSKFKKKVEWHEIVIWAADENDIKDLKNFKNSFDAERALINRFFEQGWDKLSPSQRKDVIENSDLKKLSATDKAAMIAAKGTVALATLNGTVAVSGFAFYTTMSSVVAATANVVGVTLPFAVYTGASTTVGTLTGPWGWSLLAAASTGLGLYAMKPDKVKVTRMIISLHILKAKVLKDSK